MGWRAGERESAGESDRETVERNKEGRGTREKKEVYRPCKRNIRRPFIKGKY